MSIYIYIFVNIYIYIISVIYYSRHVPVVGTGHPSRRGGHMACVVALLHDAGGRQASCDAGAFDSHGGTLGK